MGKFNKGDGDKKGLTTMNSGEDESDGLIALKEEFNRFHDEAKTKLDQHDYKLRLLMPLVQSTAKGPKEEGRQASKGDSVEGDTQEGEMQVNPIQALEKKLNDRIMKVDL